MIPPLTTHTDLLPDADIEQLVQVTGKLRQWMHTGAWPLWWHASRHENGAFCEALKFNGKPVPDTEARVRVQARQIFSFAMAHTMGWREPGLEDGIRQSIGRFMHSCLGPEGLPGTQVDVAQGRLTDATPSLYNLAFALLALAQSREALNEAFIDGHIEALLTSADRHLSLGPDHGYRETLPPDANRYQNPHMHFYEALLCLFRVTRDPHAGERAEQLLDFIRYTFFDERHGIVREIAGNGKRKTGKQYEPGHSMEWIWLLGLRSRLFGVPLDPFAIRLYRTYVKSGTPEGETPMCLAVDRQPVDASCRLWSQTEALKAHLCIYELGPPGLAEDALARAAACAVSISDRWLDSDCPGGFNDHYDSAGDMIAVDMPASMGYHLYLAVAETLRVTSRFR